MKAPAFHLQVVPQGQGFVARCPALRVEVEAPTEREALRALLERIAPLVEEALEEDDEQVPWWRA